MAENDHLLSLEEALKELQIDRDELKNLFRKNSLRYILEDGKIKIPKMALMALKLERMTSSTQQFKKMRRARRKRGATLTASQGEIMLSEEEAAQLLEVEQEQLKQYIDNERIRTVEVEGNLKIPKSSAQALKLRIDSFGPVKRLSKIRPSVRRIY